MMREQKIERERFCLCPLLCSLRSQVLVIDTSLPGFLVFGKGQHQSRLPSVGSEVGESLTLRCVPVVLLVCIVAGIRS